MLDVSAISTDQTDLSTAAYAAAGNNRLYRNHSDAADVQSVNLSFSDVVDMLNPLQHIPVLSSLYRSVADEQINPVARIAGDALYGGILGLASAGIAAVGAIADEVITASTGETTLQNVASALWDDDSTASTKLADTTPTPPQDNIGWQVASLQTPALLTPVVSYPDFSATTATGPTTTATAAATETPSKEPAMTTVASASEATQPVLGLPLDRSKQAFGGVMDSTMLANAQQNQALAMAMSGKSNLLQAQRAIRNSRFASTSLPGSNTNGSIAVVAAQANAAKNASSSAETQAAVQQMATDLQALKAVKTYQNALQSTPIPGGTLNLAN